MTQKTKRILIPTDFSVNSLGIVIDFLERKTDCTVELVLAYGQKCTSSITELLGFTKEDNIDSMQSEEFIKSCQMIKTRFGDRIAEVYTDIITSDHPNYIANYMKGGKIDEIVLTENYEFEASDSKSFNLVALFKKYEDRLRPKLIYCDTENKSISERDKIEGLFFRKALNVTFQ